MLVDVYDQNIRSRDGCLSGRQRSRRQRQPSGDAYAFQKLTTVENSILHA